MFNGFVSENVVRGVGIIARILNEKSGIVWWLKSRNNFQSVWFEAKQSFLYGVNLAEKNFFEVFKDGELHLIIGAQKYIAETETNK